MAAEIDDQHFFLCRYVSVFSQGKKHNAFFKDMVCILFSRSRWSHVIFPKNVAWNLGSASSVFWGCDFEKKNAHCMMVSLLIWLNTFQIEAGSNTNAIRSTTHGADKSDNNIFCMESTCKVTLNQKHQRKAFLCTTIPFLWVLKLSDSTAGPIGRQGLCRSKTLHLQSFVHVFYAKIALSSQVVQSRTRCQKIKHGLGAFFQQTKKQKNKNHKVTHVLDNTLLKIVGNEYCRAVHAQIVDSGRLNGTCWCLKMDFTFTNLLWNCIDRCFSCFGFRFWRNKSTVTQCHWIIAVHWSCHVKHVVLRPREES